MPPRLPDAIKHWPIYRVGDAISGGLAWTRPVRLGGVQVQKNFAARPDLITLPLPALAGSAAVPSSVDVWINAQKLRSVDGVEGRFQVTDVPVVTGGAEAVVVVRDATGREVSTRSAFYVTPNMLRAGLYDFSLEAGAPRIGYGVESPASLWARLISFNMNFQLTSGDRGLCGFLRLHSRAAAVLALLLGIDRCLSIGAEACPWAEKSCHRVVRCFSDGTETMAGAVSACVKVQLRVQCLRPSGACSATYFQHPCQQNAGASSFIEDVGQRRRRRTRCHSGERRLVEGGNTAQAARL